VPFPAIPAEGLGLVIPARPSHGLCLRRRLCLHAAPSPFQPGRPVPLSSMSWATRPACAFGVWSESQRYRNSRSSNSESVKRPSTPEASAASLPPLLLRLLPGGANQIPGGIFTRCEPAPFTAHEKCGLDVRSLWFCFARWSSAAQAADRGQTNPSPYGCDRRVPQHGTTRQRLR
jgi:hypothetical protein